MNLHAALVEIVALTEAMVTKCQSGDASPELLLELTLQRATILATVAKPPVTSTAERTLVTSLQDLDLQLVQWCSDAQREIERSRAQLVHRDASPTPTPDAARVLSDIA